MLIKQPNTYRTLLLSASLSLCSFFVYAEERVSSPTITNSTQAHVVQRTAPKVAQETLQLPEKIKPSYIPLDKLQFKEAAIIDKAINDEKDRELAENIIEEIRRTDLWPVGHFKEVRKQITNLIMVNAHAPEKRIHSQDFYDRLESILTKKMRSHGGFLFQECVTNCDEKTKVFIGDERMTINRTQGVEEFLKEKTKDKKVDGVLKWKFISQGSQALLDIRFINSNNVVVWQDTISSKLKTEFELQEDDEDTIRKNRITIGLKSQTITHIPEDGETSESDLLWVLSYGLKDEVKTFTNLRYYIGTRIQANAQSLDQFLYLTIGIDARIGYKIDPEILDNLVIYGAFFQDFVIPTGMSTAAILEWTISKDYSIGMGFEIPITADRQGSSAANKFKIGSNGFWFELSARL